MAGNGNQHSTKHKDDGRGNERPMNSGGFVRHGGTRRSGDDSRAVTQQRDFCQGENHYGGNGQHCEHDSKFSAYESFHACNAALMLMTSEQVTRHPPTSSRDRQSRSGKSMRSCSPQWQPSNRRQTIRTIAGERPTNAIFGMACSWRVHGGSVGREDGLSSVVWERERPRLDAKRPMKNGRSDRIRTCDFVDPNHAL